MKIEELLDSKSIKIGLVAKTKKEALNQMVDLANKTNKILDISNIKRQVLLREELSSTAIGNAVALPHTKSVAVSSIVASLCILKTPLTDFQSPDDKPVQILFLLLANENQVGKQLRYLSYFAKLFSDIKIVEQIQQCNTETDIMNFLVEISEEL